MATNVKELRTALLNAQFSQALKCCNRIGWSAVYERMKRSSAPEALAAISMSSEILDYFGKFKEAERRLAPVVSEAEKRLRSLVGHEVAKPKTALERRVWKAWVWILIQQAMVHYRKLEFDSATQLLTLCEEAVLHSIRSYPKHPCDGSLARIYYVSGLVFRERFDFASAKTNFLKSIECAWQSIREKSQQKPGRGFRQSLWTDLAIARALALGLGFVYHSEAQADLALPLLLSSKNLLARLKGEVLISTYVDLIYFDARRSAHGGNSEVVAESIAGLEECHATFSKLGHDLYRARAAYSLALAYSQRAREDETSSLTDTSESDLKKAESYSVDLEKYGFKAHDPRAAAYAMLCRSRIERKRNNLVEAEDLATETTRLAKGEMHAHVHVAGLIARAEARFRQDKIDDAIRDFREAAECSMNNLRSRAVCYLRLVEIYAKRGHSKLASQYFEQWKQIKLHITNAYLHRLEGAAEAAMERASSDFVIRRTAPTLDRQEREVEFYRFLAGWAKEQAGTDQAAARLLKVSRQTLLNWRLGKHGARG